MFAFRLMPALTTCPVLFQDRWLVVIDKPAGVLSHPNASGGSARIAFEGTYDMKARRFDSPAGKLWLIHRLDQDTSGVLIAALDEATARKCRDAFDDCAVKKTYIALVKGGPKAEGAWLDHLVTAQGRGAVRTSILKGRAPNAELRYRVLHSAREHRASLIEIDLITGKTHQIRVQSAARNHPVIGDDVYGDFPLNRALRKSLAIRRLCLHARRIELKHPATGIALRIEAPMPEVLTAFVASL